MVNRLKLASRVSTLEITLVALLANAVIVEYAPARLLILFSTFVYVASSAVTLVARLPVELATAVCNSVILAFVVRLLAMLV